MTLFLVKEVGSAGAPSRRTDVFFAMRSLHPTCLLIGSLVLMVGLLNAWSLPAQREYVQIFPEIKLQQQEYRNAKVVASPDGGWAIAETDSVNRWVRVLRFDACGELEWARNLEWEAFVRPHRVGDLIFDPGGDLVIGTSYLGSGPPEMHLVRLDPNGDLVWSRSWQSWDLFASPFSIDQLPDGRFVVVGLCRPFAVISDLVMVIDQTGDLLSSRNYYTSVIGYHPVGLVLRDGSLMIRRGDRFYAINPDGGEVLWQIWNIAPLYNSCMPIQLDTGFMVLGQYSNSNQLFSATPVRLDDDGVVTALGDIFPAVGGVFGNVENLRIRRIAEQADGTFVTVTTDSLAQGYLSLVTFDRAGQVLREIYLRPGDGQYRFLDHDFDLLSDGTLAIAASANGQLAVLKVRPDTLHLCGMDWTDQAEPYSLNHITQPLNISPTDFPLDEVVRPVDITDLDLDVMAICDSIPRLPDRLTMLPGCPGDSLVADAADPMAESWLWDDGSMTSTVPIRLDEERTVLVSGPCGDYQHRFIAEQKEECPCTVEFPNLFTPNSDGTNDQFGPRSDCPLIEYRLEVFNRWGQQVFQTDQVGEMWDGRVHGEPVPSDVYAFVATFRIDGDAQQQLRRGEMTVLR